MASGDAQIAAEVSYLDNWLINVAPGTAPGVYTLPVTFNIHGSVSPESFARNGTFIRCVMTTRNIYTGVGPFSSLFEILGSTTIAGIESKTFNGTVDFRYFGPGSALPPTAEVTVLMSAPQLATGTIDYFNTASVSLTLPTGWSATTSSGLPLVFVSAIPEPTTYAMVIVGLGFLLAVRLKGQRSSTA